MTPAEALASLTPREVARRAHGRDEWGEHPHALPVVTPAHVTEAAHHLVAIRSLVAEKSSEKCPHGCGLAEPHNEPLTATRDGIEVTVPADGWRCPKCGEKFVDLTQLDANLAAFNAAHAAKVAASKPSQEVLALVRDALAAAVRDAYDEGRECSAPDDFALDARESRCGEIVALYLAPFQTQEEPK